MDYDLISKMNLEELKNHFRIRDLNVSGRKNELLARVLAASDNGVKLIKTAVEIQADLKTEYLAKLKINDSNIPGLFKSANGCMNKDGGMKFCPILL